MNHHNLLKLLFETPPILFDFLFQLAVVLRVEEFMKLGLDPVKSLGLMLSLWGSIPMPWVFHLLLMFVLEISISM